MGNLAGSSLAGKYGLLRSLSKMPYKTKSGQWMAQVRISSAKLYRHRCKTKREAAAWEEAKRQELEHQVEACETIRTVSLHEWATAYLDFAKDRFVQKTYEEKRLAFREMFSSGIAPESRATGLSGKDVLVFLQGEAGESGNAANKKRKNLRAAWEWGKVFLDLPDKNPFSTVPRFAEVRHERRIPAIEDFWKAFEKAEAQDKTLLLLLLHTGARRDEAFRLSWKDVDLPGKRVRLMWRKNNQGEWRESWLPMSEDVIEALKKQRQVTGLLGNVFMWRTDDGKWLPYQYRQHWLKKLCKRAGVEPFGFHGIRHLFASILASKNVPLVEIQKMLRHGSIQTTARYIHSLQKEGSREALEALPRVKEAVG
jgi:integrase